MKLSLSKILYHNSINFHKVIPFDPLIDVINTIDLSKTNTSLTAEIYSNAKLFSQYINLIKEENKAKYLIGGYNEEREIYKRSILFDFEKKLLTPNDNLQKLEEPRRLHLGIDIWGNAGTPVLAPLGGMVHSFAFNNNFGDYGATIILQHNIDTTPFHTLYGHVSLNDFINLREGQFITRGQCFAHFGNETENGNWPPHLHFQIIEDMQFKEGDYPGVCKVSEKDFYLTNCPDADLILNMTKYF